MKALTTKLYERAAKPTPAEGLKMWRDAAQAQIDEPVVDACLFSRPYSYGGGQVASHAGGLATMLLRKSREIRAGGLPEHYVLAVTADEVTIESPSEDEKVQCTVGSSPLSESFVDLLGNPSRTTPAAG